MNDNLKIEYLRLAKELTGSTDLDELFTSASRIAQYVANVPEVEKPLPLDILTFAQRCKPLWSSNPASSLVLYNFQREYLEKLERAEQNIMLAAFGRQLGSTLMLLIYALFEATQKADQTIVLLSNTLQQVAQEFDNLKSLGGDNVLPKMVESNRLTIVFENGSRIIGRAATTSAIRGLRPTHLLIDNAAYISYKSLAEILDNVVIRSGVRLVVQSTPKFAEGPFYKLYASTVEAQRVHYTWNDHPERDSQWRERTVDLMGIRAFRNEMEAEFQCPPVRTSLPTSDTWY